MQNPCDIVLLSLRGGSLWETWEPLTSHLGAMWEASRPSGATFDAILDYLKPHKVILDVLVGRDPFPPPARPMGRERERRKGKFFPEWEEGDALEELIP